MEEAILIFKRWMIAALIFFYPKGINASLHVQQSSKIMHSHLFHKKKTEPLFY